MALQRRRAALGLASRVPERLRRISASKDISHFSAQNARASRHEASTGGLISTANAQHRMYNLAWAPGEGDWYVGQMQ